MKKWLCGISVWLLLIAAIGFVVIGVQQDWPAEGALLPRNWPALYFLAALACVEVSVWFARWRLTSDPALMDVTIIGSQAVSTSCLVPRYRALARLTNPLWGLVAIFIPFVAWTYWEGISWLGHISIALTLVAQWIVAINSAGEAASRPDVLGRMEFRSLSMPISPPRTSAEIVSDGLRALSGRRSQTTRGSSDSSGHINPATGLPMAGGIGGFDVAGNAYGQSGSEINPATGLPMIGGIGSIDVMGNPYGTDLHSQHAISSSVSSFGDNWDNSVHTASSFDDSWNSSSSIGGSSWDD